MWQQVGSSRVQRLCSGPRSRRWTCGGHILSFHSSLFKFPFPWFQGFDSVHVKTRLRRPYLPSPQAG